MLTPKHPSHRSNASINTEILFFFSTTLGERGHRTRVPAAVAVVRLAEEAEERDLLCADAQKSPPTVSSWVSLTQSTFRLSNLYTHIATPDYPITRLLVSDSCPVCSYDIWIGAVMLVDYTARGRSTSLRRPLVNCFKSSVINHLVAIVVVF